MIERITVQVTFKTTKTAAAHSSRDILVTAEGAGARKRFRCRRKWRSRAAKRRAKKSAVERLSSVLQAYNTAMIAVDTAKRWYEVMRDCAVLPHGDAANGQIATAVAKYVRQAVLPGWTNPVGTPTTEGEK